MCDLHQKVTREMEALEKRVYAVQKDVVTITGQREEWRRRAEAAERKTLAADQLGAALANLLEDFGGVRTADGAPAPRVDEDAIVRRVLAQVPSNGAGPVTVTPPEKLRKEFQREEADRIVAGARAFKPLTKRVLKLMEALEGGFLFQKAIADRLGRSMGGGARVDLGMAVKELEERGWVTVDGKRGVGSNLRAQIAADLDSYLPAADEVEQVYQSVLYVLATEGEAAA